MIGIFDSGYGGLTILRGLVDALPQYDYCYLADNARVPYGSRSAEEIFQFTLQGVEELFRRGCPLVILACNTSSANALRRIQQEVLPVKYPDRRVLGILVPTVERFGEETVGILATEATVRSLAYVREAAERAPEAHVLQQACPDLVPLIESGAEEAEIYPVLQVYLDALFVQGPIDTVLLGCTHYALIAPFVAELLPVGVRLLEQSALVAKSFADYLHRHPELTKKLSVTERRTFLTTADPAVVSAQASRFFGQVIHFDHVIF